MIRDRDGCYGQAVTKRLAAIGIPRSPDRREVALAERACGETDRLDPPGMPRSHRRLRRGPPAPNPYGLQRLLQRPANTSVAGQGFAAPSIGPAPRQARRSADPRRAAPSILPDVVFSRDNPNCRNCRKSRRGGVVWKLTGRASISCRLLTLCLPAQTEGLANIV